VVRLGLAELDARRARRNEIEDFGRHQPIVYHDAGPAAQAMGLDRQQLGISGVGADEITVLR